MGGDLGVLEERTAEIKDVRMRYYVGGEGPPVILVHGLGGAAANWAGVVAAARRPAPLARA